jgi:hypothetical protein
MRSRIHSSTLSSKQILSLSLAAFMIGLLTPPELMARNLRDAAVNAKKLSGSSGIRTKAFDLAAHQTPGISDERIENDGGTMPSRRQVPGVKPPAPPTREELEGRIRTIRINGSELTIQSGEPVTLSAVPIDSRGNAIQGLHVSWASSNREVVRLTSEDEVVGATPGNASLTVRVGGVTRTVQVRVIARNDL